MTAPSEPTAPQPEPSPLVQLQVAESRLTPAQLEVWRQVVARVGPDDVGLLNGLMIMVQRDRTFEQIAPFLPGARRTHGRDYRTAAAGDR